MATARSQVRLSKPGEPEIILPGGTSWETADWAVRMTPSPTVQWPAMPTWPARMTLLPMIADLTVSIEDHGGLYEIPIFRDEFLATLTDLEPREMGRVVRLARDCERRIAAGTLDSLAAAERTPWEERVLPRLNRIAAYVRAVVAGLSA